VRDPVAARRERVGDEAPMALRGHPFGTHERRRAFGSKSLQLDQTLLERLRRRPILEAAGAHSAERRPEPRVGDLSRLKVRVQPLAREMWMPSRHWEPPDVADLNDVGRATQLDERIKTLCGVADGQDDAAHEP
jgi:hypothetical protein